MNESTKITGRGRARAVLAAALTALAVTAYGQAGSGTMSVEDSYLQESVELMIIREYAAQESWSAKQTALQYIGEAINNGNRGKDIQDVLAMLAEEGTVNLTRENGRVINNFPDIRVKVAGYLGELGAEDTLKRMLQIEEEPMVLTAIVRSLGSIDVADGTEITVLVSTLVTRFDVRRQDYPENALADAALQVYEKLAGEGKVYYPATLPVLMRLSEGRYAAPVKVRARALLERFRLEDATKRASAR